MSLQDTLEQINNFDINDIDWSRIGVWPLVARIAICLLVMVSVFGAIYFFYTKDIQQTLVGEASREQQLRIQFQKRVSEAATLDQYKILIAKMNVDFDSLVAQLPKKTQVPGLLDNIDEKGSESGLDIVSIKLQPEEKGAFHVTLPIDIVVTGDYHNLGVFVSGVAGMARIVTLHDFEITTGKDGTILRMSIKAKTYSSLDDGGA
jgi:type IV pilus assembly protein PilO